MFRIGEHYQNAARDLESLIPDLNKVRNETLSVLFGETAQAADDQFAMLFDGEHAVDKLSEAVSALGDGAGNLGVEIEYAKLSILVGLALAAVEISWCLAMSGPTFGASTAAIPAIEALTMAAIRRVVLEVLERLAARLREMFTRTMVSRLLYEFVQEAFQELGIGLTQEGIAQGIQINNGHRAGFDQNLIRQTAVASAVGGAAGGATAVPVGHMLGPAANRWSAAAKGATTFFSAGVVGNLAGTAAVGGELDWRSVLAGSAFSSLGGLRGAGIASTHGAGNPSDPQTGPPPGKGFLPPADAGPVGPNDDGGPSGQPDAAHNTDNDNKTAGPSPVGHTGARVPDGTPSSAKTTNTPAAQRSPSTASADAPTTAESTDPSTEHGIDHTTSDAD
ncbi:hypothetical protein ACRCUN_34120, partial [Mycobacterium sp. LTG2003]